MHSVHTINSHYTGEPYAGEPYTGTFNLPDTHTQQCDIFAGLPNLSNVPGTDTDMPARHHAGTFTIHTLHSPAPNASDQRILWSARKEKTKNKTSDRSALRTKALAISPLCSGQGSPAHRDSLAQNQGNPLHHGADPNRKTATHQGPTGRIASLSQQREVVGPGPRA